MFNRHSSSRIWTGIVALLSGVAGYAAPAQWSQWGGPNRDFTVATGGLADTWPDDGPPVLWKRELGDGYSTITVDRGTLYTMYRVDQDEFVVALNAETGVTVWEHKNPSPFTPAMNEYGPGPHATPLIVGKRLFTVGTNCVFQCFDKTSGELLWKHDLVKKFGAPIPHYGYAASAIAFKDTIIIPVDRERPEEAPPGAEDSAKEESEPPVPQSLVAFDQATGDVVWKAQDLKMSYSSPILIEFDGKEQLVVFTAEEIAGVDPNDGTLLWQHPFPTQYGGNLSTPVWDGQDLIFASAAYGSGSRAIRLGAKDGKIVPTELWHSKKLRIHHANVLIIGNYVYGSSGDFGTAFFAALNVQTGKVAWRQRGFAKATFVYGDGKLILLDEDGQLALTTVDGEGMTIHSKCTVAERTAWTAPTLVDQTLYIRDRKHLTAFDIGKR